MKRFFRMLLAVLFCTTAMCIFDVNANTFTSKNAQKSTDETIQDSIQNAKSIAVNTNSGAYSDEEVYLAAQLVHHEAHNQTYNGKVAVAEVVLNRVKSSLFPNNIKDVIFQSGQFTNSRRLSNINPTDLELKIAYNVLNGSLRTLNDEDIMYFRNPKMTSGISAAVDKNWGKLDYVTHIGDHAFYSQDEATLLAAAGSENDGSEVSTGKKKFSIFNMLPGSISISKFFGLNKNEKAVKKNEPVNNIVVSKESATEVQSEPEAIEEPELQFDKPIEEMTEEELALAQATQLQEVLSAQYYAQREAQEALLLGQNESSEEDADDLADDDLNQEIINVNNAILLAQANAVALKLEESKETQDDLLEEEFDENDPVAVARRQALLNEKAEVERRERQLAEEKRANEAAQQQAVLLDKMQVEKVARENAAIAKATQAAVDRVKAEQANR